MFAVLCADPPWQFGDRLPGPSRGAEKNYPCLSVEELCAFPLPPLTDDATLFLWRVASMQQEALDVIRAWGFVLKTEIIWYKKTAHGKRHFGMGRTLRAEHEVCLVGQRGKPKTLSHSVRSVFDFDGFDAAYEGHSTKPEVFYTIVESLREGPYVELFARRERRGWTTLGNQVVPLERTLFC